MGLDLDYLDGQTPLDEDEKEGLLISTVATRGELDEFEQQNVEQAFLWTLKEDQHLNDLLIDQVYQFSRMYWKSVSQHNLPVTLAYPEMVAEIYPYFKYEKLPSFGEGKLWFL